MDDKHINSLFSFNLTLTTLPRATNSLSKVSCLLCRVWTAAMFFPSSSCGMDASFSCSKARTRRECKHYKAHHITKHIDARITRHIDARITRHIDARITRHIDARITKHIDARITRHIDARITRHIDARITRHIDARITRHIDARITRHIDACNG